MTEQRAVVVGIDGSPHSELAQRWAVAEARFRKLPLRLVCAYTWNINIGSPAAPAHEPDIGAEELLRRMACRAIQNHRGRRSH